MFSASPISVEALPRVGSDLYASRGFVSMRAGFFFRGLTGVLLHASMDQSMVVYRVRICSSVVGYYRGNFLRVLVSTYVSGVIPRSG